MSSTAMLRAFVGGIGSGKSYVGALDLIRRAKPGRTYVVTAPTYSMLEDATFRSVRAMAQELDIVNPEDIKAAAPPCIKLRTGAEILFRSTDNPETLRGPNLSGVWMDEASLSKQDAFDILVGRLREGGELGWLSATYTPKGKVHWSYKTFATGQPDTFLVHARSDENPFLPPTFVHKVRARYTAQQARQELGGEFIEGGGGLYCPSLWPRYTFTGDAYRIKVGAQYRHIRVVECSRLLTLDWAMGKPKNDARSKQAAVLGELKGDCTAFVVADMSPDGLLFPLWALNERIPLQNNAARLAEVCRRWRPMVVAGDDDNLSETMLLETRRYADIPMVKPMHIGGKNKIVRSQASVVRAERGMVYLPDDVVRPGMDNSWVSTLSDQLESFTGADGEPDDIADAFGLLGRLADEFVPGEDSREDYEPALGATGYRPDGGDGYQQN